MDSAARELEAWRRDPSTPLVVEARLTAALRGACKGLDDPALLTCLLPRCSLRLCFLFLDQQPASVLVCRRAGRSTSRPGRLAAARPRAACRSGMRWMRAEAPAVRRCFKQLEFSNRLLAYNTAYHSLSCTSCSLKPSGSAQPLHLAT